MSFSYFFQRSCYVLLAFSPVPPLSFEAIVVASWPPRPAPRLRRGGAAELRLRALRRRRAHGPRGGHGPLPLPPGLRGGRRRLCERRRVRGANQRIQPFLAVFGLFLAILCYFMACDQLCGQCYTSTNEVLASLKTLNFTIYNII